MRAHRHPYYDPSCVELSDDVCIRPTVHGGDPDVTDGRTGGIACGPVEHLAGFIIAHEREGGGPRHEGAVHVCTEHPHANLWQMTGSLEGGDLTLSPSVLCRDVDNGSRADFHGFVREGRWIPA